MNLESYKQLLKRLRNEVEQESASSAQSQEPVVLDQQSVGRLSRMDAIQGQQMAQASERRRQQRLRAIQAALVRIEQEDFGYCEECGEEIAVKRLQFDPTTRYCIECLSEREKANL